MPISSAPSANIVAADAQLRGARTTRRSQELRRRWTMRSDAMPLPPSDFTKSVIVFCGPITRSISWSAITSLSHTEPEVEVQ